MATQGPLLILLLMLAVLAIIVGTSRLKIHPFLILLAVAYGLGLASGVPADKTIAAITKGFGDTIGAIGIVIASGAIIGSVLEAGGGTQAMASTVLRWVGEGRSVLAMSVTGAVVSVLVFCDSGFIILSSLSRSLAASAKRSMATYSVALGLGLYTTHVFVPPTPGPIAAAQNLGTDLGALILWGLVVSVPVIAVTCAFASLMGRRIYIDPDSGKPANEPAETRSDASVAAWRAFLPIVVPLTLIGLKSVADFPGGPLGQGRLADFLSAAGNPNLAVPLGILLAIGALPRGRRGSFSKLAESGLANAAGIILITGAGGAFGRVLQTTAVGDYLGGGLASLEVGILAPFLIAAALKTAQGSSTVSIITTSAILAPLLPGLGLAEGLGPVWTALAIGAGSMTVSHANDSYFWVVSRFSGMTVTQAYKLHTLGSLVAGVTGLVSLFLLKFIVG